jgi:ribose-phosphate pyrophosphokinase
MKPVVFAMPENRDLARRLDGQHGDLILRSFPDGETYVRLETPVSERTVLVVCALNHPNDKILPLLLAADAARDLGAARVGLVAPYLSYLRQDARFTPGEAVSSKTFARLLSEFDALFTVDPHLHRYTSLQDVYSIPTFVAHAAPLVAEWIRHQAPYPLIIGPDQESRQWVASVAGIVKAPHVTLEKTRRDDRTVEIAHEDVSIWRDRTPVLIDDIISTGNTLIAAAAHFKAEGFPAPLAVAVHGVFAERAYANLQKAGFAKIVTCNTIPHPSNEIDIVPLLSQAVNEWVQKEKVASAL